MRSWEGCAGATSSDKCRNLSLVQLFDSLLFTSDDGGCPELGVIFMFLFKSGLSVDSPWGIAGSAGVCALGGVGK